VTGATILCGVSGADPEQVLDTARRVAAAYDGQLVVVHVFEGSAAGAEQVLADVRRRTADDRHVETRLVEGSPATRLLEIAAEEAADLLVVGSRGRGAVAGSVLGSVSRELTGGALCPVVVVPPNAREVERQGDDAAVVVGVDGSSHAFAAVRIAGELADRLGGRVVVVHAPRTVESMVAYVGRSTTPSLSVQPDEAARESRRIVDEAVDRLGRATTAVCLEPGPPAQVLDSVARREGAGLIVIAARGVSGLHAAVLGSVAVSLVGSADVPVVVVPEPAERAVMQAR
jgi:nucleotide-binding universal stress UspA family protein